MALTLEAKKTVVAQVSEVAQSAHSVVAAEYRGMTVAQMTEFRNKAREQDVYVRVVPNNLARRAVVGTEFECMGESLIGPLVLAFSREDPGAAARVVRDYAKGNDRLKPKLVALGGQLLPTEQLDSVANLPTREEALSRLLGVLMAPANKLVRTLAEPQASLARVLGARRDQQQEQTA